MSKSLIELGLVEVAEKVKKKEVSPVEVVQACLEEIKAKDGEINAFITLTEDKALEQAKAAEQEIMSGQYKGELHGIPIALKDNIYTKGVRTTIGSEIYKDFIPEENAEIVNKLEASGAISLGKLNMHQFAYGTTGDRSYFGPTRNPHDLSKVTGGSSSGSGAAVAANFVYGTIGTDTGGSIRIPASACGIVGMKPTFGLVSKHGTHTLAWTLDHLGPMTKTVLDNATMLNHIAGYDPKDPFSVKADKVDYTEEIGKSLAGLTIGIPNNFYFDVMQEEIRASFEQTVKDLEASGVTIKYVDIPYMEELLTAQHGILMTEGYAALEREFRESPQLIEEEVRSRIVGGMYVSAAEYFQMLKIKHLAIEEFLKLYQEVDVFMTPTLAAAPCDIDQREIEVPTGKEHPRLYNRLTGPMNTTGFPAISVPGIPAKGLPMGIQFFGPPFSEKRLYRFAAAVEKLYR